MTVYHGLTNLEKPKASAGPQVGKIKALARPKVSELGGLREGFMS